MHGRFLNLIVEALDLPDEGSKAAARGKLDTAFADMDVVVWSTGDITGEAETQRKDISEEDARALLHKMLRKHDASMGITWDTIHEYLSDFPDLPVNVQSE